MDGRVRRAFDGRVRRTMMRARFARGRSCLSRARRLVDDDDEARLDVSTDVSRRFTRHLAPRGLRRRRARALDDVMTSVRDRIAAFSRGRVAPVEEAEEDAPAAHGSSARRFDASPPPTTTTARDAARVEANVVVDDARASTRGPTRARGDDEAASGRDDVDGTARATAFERASDALALARAVEATLRRERVFEDAERRARVRVEAAERAYEAVARRRAPGDDGDRGEGKGDAHARTSGQSRADASTASVVRSFSFARADEGASDDEDVTPDARDGSFSADADGDDAVAAVRDIDAARRKIARLLKRATTNASQCSETHKPSRRDRFELELSRSASLRRELARDRVAMLDSILAALAVDDE